MHAAYVESFNASDPVSALVVGDRPTPVAWPGWTLVRVRAASLNHHDIWSLRGVGLRGEHLPMILGCDVAGTTEDGRDVIVHPVVTDDLGTSLLSERHQGTFAELVAVPEVNLVAKPETMTFGEAACLPTAWLTAYQMLFERAEVRPGQTVLIQGAGGGLATALVMLAKAGGATVWVTSRSPERGQYACGLGADAAFASGAQLPERVDAVMDSVGEATWEHSLKCLRPGGVMVVSGATSGYRVSIDVARLFASQLRILGSSMGTLASLRSLVTYCAAAGVHPPIDRVVPLDSAADAFASMVAGDVAGKLVLAPGAGAHA